MDPIDIDALPGSFRETAKYLREHAASEQAACAWEKAAEKLEGALGDARTEALKLEEAEAESGYSRSHLRRLIRDGIVPNAGTENRPKILRKDLPKKPGHGVRQRQNQGVSSKTQVATRVIQGGMR